MNKKFEIEKWAEDVDLSSSVKLCYTATQEEFSNMHKQTLKDELAYYNNLKQRMRDAQMVYQYEEKHAVAKHYKISFDKLANLEFHRWRKIANRYADRLYNQKSIMD